MFNNRLPANNSSNMRLNKIAGRFSPPPSSSLLLLLQRVEINLLNYYTINPFFTAKDVIISFRACSCIIDYFILLSRCAEVQYFVFPTGVYAEVGFNGVYSAPECNCRHHLGAVSNTSHAYSNCKHFPCSIFFFVSGGGCIHFVFAVLRQLTDNEKMVLLQTCDQLKLH